MAKLGYEKPVNPVKAKTGNLLDDDGQPLKLKGRGHFNKIAFSDKTKLENKPVKSKLDEARERRAKSKRDSQDRIHVACNAGKVKAWNAFDKQK